MARSFDMTAEYHYPVERVHRAFGDEQYWIARLADSGADAVTLDSIHADADGGIEIATTQTLGRNRLPALVSQFHKGELTIVRHEKWGPVSGGEANAVLDATVTGAPVSVNGKAALTPTAAGSRLLFNTTVEVAIPLVGGKIESYLGGALRDLVVAEQRFTSVWLEQHA